MWVMTSFGILMPSLKPPETVPDGDPRTLQIRTRRKLDLNRLRKHYMPELGPTYAVEDSDYEYRADCTPQAWAEALVLISLDIDYVKFKPTAIDRWRDHHLHDVYLAVWAVVLDLGRRRPRRRRGLRTTPFVSQLTDAEIEQWLRS